MLRRRLPQPQFASGGGPGAGRKMHAIFLTREADVLGVGVYCAMAELLAERRCAGERVYPTSWARCDRDADYRQAWAEFERRLGKKMPVV